MSMMERGTISEQAVQGRMRGMSYGQYVAARFYPVTVERPLPDGGVIRREQALPPLLPGAEELAAACCNRGTAGSERAAKRKKEVVRRYCVVCGGLLRGNYRKYCSEECREAAKKERAVPPVSRATAVREDKPCAVCGAVMYGAVRGKRYCGPECRKVGTARLQREYREAHPEPRKPRFCRICGVRIEGSGLKYCSGCTKAETARRNRERFKK